MIFRSLDGRSKERKGKQQIKTINNNQCLQIFNATWNLQFLKPSDPYMQSRNNKVPHTTGTKSPWTNLAQTLFSLHPRLLEAKTDDERKKESMNEWTNNDKANRPPPLAAKAPPTGTVAERNIWRSVLAYMNGPLFFWTAGQDGEGKTRWPGNSPPPFSSASSAEWYLCCYYWHWYYMRVCVCVCVCEQCTLIYYICITTVLCTHSVARERSLDGHLRCGRLYKLPTVTYIYTIPLLAQMYMQRLVLWPYSP